MWGAALLATWLSATPVHAAATEDGEPAWRVGIALGYGERSNPLIQSRAIPVVADLDIAWFGRRFFFDNGDLGFTFSDGRSGTASLVARVNSDRVFFGKTNARFVTLSVTGAALDAPLALKPPGRRFAVESGIEYLVDGRWGRMSLSGFHDVSGVHGGFAVDMEYARPVFGQRWTIEPAVLLRYKSARLNNYYWGVRAAEASPALPAYIAGAGLNVQLGLRSSFYLTRQLRLVGSVSAERLNPDASSSPLVAQRDVLGYFGGFAYQF